jgi:hypothetical protein
MYTESWLFSKMDFSFARNFSCNVSSWIVNSLMTNMGCDGIDGIKKLLQIFLRIFNSPLSQESLAGHAKRKPVS